MQKARTKRFVYSRLPWAGVLIISLLALLAWLLFVYKLPGTTRFWASMQNAGHALMFFTLSFTLLIVQKFLFVRESRVAAVLVVFIVCGIIGGLTEITQNYVGRSGNWGDFYLDLQGALAGIFFYLAMGESLFKASMFALAGLGVLVYACSEPLSWQYAEQRRDWQLPILSDFEKNWPYEFVEARYSAKLEVQKAPDAWATNQTSVVKVFFNPGSWPGIWFRETPRNWSRYKSLSFEVFNPGEHTEIIVLRVHDLQHNNRHNDRYNRTLGIKPGATTVTISIDDMQQAPKGREMDLKNIQSLMLYMLRPKKQKVLYFDNFELHR